MLIWIGDAWHFAKRDFNVWPLRFCLEFFAWILSVGCSLTMAVTVPNPPFIPLYIAFITQCAIFAWAAYTRKSFSMVANYILLISIDVIALSRLLLLQFS